MLTIIGRLHEPEWSDGYAIHRRERKTLVSGSQYSNIQYDRKNQITKGEDRKCQSKYKEEELQEF
jgi:hypothetical protein